jgi:ketosteroid isomerase-like protein
MDTDHVHAEVTAIRAMLECWVESTRHGDNDHVLDGHAQDVLIFDVLPPLKYEGAQAYRASWANWQPSFEIPSLFELHELWIQVASDVAFAHALVRCGGKLPSGKHIEDWVRATFCLRKHAGAWEVAHQHLSMPLPSK